MSFLNKLRPGAGDIQPVSEADQPQPVTENKQATDGVLADDEEKAAAIAASAPDQDAQRGVQEMEAVTLVWTKGSLALLLCL